MKLSPRHSGYPHFQPKQNQRLVSSRPNKPSPQFAGKFSKPRHSTIATLVLALLGGGAGIHYATWAPPKEAAAVSKSAIIGTTTGYVDQQGNVYKRGAFWRSGRVEGNKAYDTWGFQLAEVSPEGKIYPRFSPFSIGSVGSDGKIYDVLGFKKGQVESSNLSLQEKGAAGFLLFLQDEDSDKDDSSSQRRRSSSRG